MMAKKSQISRYFLLLAVFTSLFSILPAQHDWTWTFGDSILMRFPGGGAPVVDTSIKTRYFFEGSAAYSDSNSDLLLYLSELGIHEANGSYVAGSPAFYSDQITNGLMILDDTRHSDTLYCYRISYTCPSPISYCVWEEKVALRDQGQDTVVISRQLPFYSPLYTVTEKLAAVPDISGKGFWLLYHGEEDKFICARVGDGRFPTIQVQSIGSNYAGVGNNPFFTVGEMTFSPQGDKVLAVTQTGVVDLFDFDRCTGLLSNWDSLGTPALVDPGPDHFYGCSFSPDGTKIYASEQYSYNYTRLWQWDLTAPDIRASKTLIYSVGDSMEFGQHQLGPDGKIYVTQRHRWIPLDSGNLYLSVINDPDQPGLACNFSYLSLYLQGRRTTYNLPNLPNYSLPPLVAMYADCGPSRRICPGDSVLLGVADTTGGAVDFLWSGQGITDPAQSQQWVSPDSSGWYFLRVTDSAVGIPCGVTVDSVWIEVVAGSEIPAVSLGADTTICSGDSVTLTASAGPGTWEYAWSTGDTAGSVSVSVDGIYAVTVTYPGGTLHCHSSSDSVRLNVEQPLSHTAPRDTSFCPGECVEIGVDAVAGMTYQWSPTAGLANPTASRTRAQPGGTTSYTLTVVDSSIVTSNCRERAFPVLVREVGCNMQSFIAAGGSGLADVLDLGPHGGRMTLQVWDAAGRLVYLSEDYKNDWGATGLARGLYIYRATVEGDPMAIGCGAGSFTGKIMVIN